MFAVQFRWDRVTFNGHEAAGYVIKGGPHADSLYFSMAVALPRLFVRGSDLPVVTREAAALPKRKGGTPRRKRRAG